MRKPEIADELIRYIEGNILAGNYLPGQKLPSIRSFGMKFGLSYNAVWRGIEFLCAEGKLIKSAKRGLYINPEPLGSPVRPARRIAVLVPSYLKDLGMINTALQEIQRLAIECGYELLVMPRPDMVLDDALCRRLNETCCAAIMMREYDSFQSSRALLIPAVGMLMDDDLGGQVSIVGQDPFDAARQAVGFFLSRGVKRVYIRSSGFKVFMRIARLFEQDWLDAGGEIGALSRIEIDFGEDEPPEPPELEDYIPGCGYFFTSDHILKRHADFYREKYGRGLPRDCAILGNDGKSRIMPWNADWPTIAVDWKNIGRTIFAECITRLTNPVLGPRRIYLGGKLVSR